MGWACWKFPHVATSFPGLTCLLTAKMEFLMGNPFTTPVGHCIERATDGSLPSEDWTLNMEICDIINETEDGPKDAIRAVKKRLNGNRNYREVMLALTVLETCVKNCGHRFHSLVTSRDFVDGVLVKIISPKNNPPTIVQDKVLALIQAWADAFRSSPDLTGVVQIYEELKRKGIEFPLSDLETLSPIHTPQRTASAPEGDSALHKYTAPSQPVQQPVSKPYTNPQVPNIHPSGAVNPTPEQICRLRSELDVVRGNTKVMSEMLTEMVPGQEDTSDYELLQELNRTCRAMQQRIVELISCVSNEAVTEELLHVNDDLNNIFLRYERYERFRSGRSTAQSVNNGVLSEATEDNLIDLGPASPAVVSNKPAPTSLPPNVTADAGRPSSPATLASRLAGLDVGAQSVSSTLSSLTSCKPPGSQDEFDVFAQTRTGSLPEPNMMIPAEDGQTAGAAAVLPPPTMDVKQPRAGVCLGGQSSVMDDIEEWLSTDVKGDDGEEGVTSEEFDKFLEERAKAAEMVASMPSPPSGDPSTEQETPSHKKPDRPEDTLFAM
ncbi:TOM1-like protein 2 isoform X2 [Corythoichthys intestinalis]|uniref:TOM1-like protein 2 isoform X2 n=1 Tax=Corythoichthys intestinalis TaxID=161448 RepID=UPI0025A65163|nr:TOM1-like protein 2 isoform X2 [Corythoichthys intestinalis]